MSSATQLAFHVMPPLSFPTNPTLLNIPTPSLFFGAKSQLRLKDAFNIARYYETTGRALSASNIHWNPVIKTFTKHWNSLTAQKDATDPEVPNISRPFIS